MQSGRKKMKVKIIANENTEILEQEINEFIKDKTIIDIKFNSYTLFSGSTPHLMHYVYDRVMILYKE